MIGISEQDEEVPPLVIPPFPPTPPASQPHSFATFLAAGVTVPKKDNATISKHNQGEQPFEPHDSVDSHGQSLFPTLILRNGVISIPALTKEIPLLNSWEIGKEANDWVEPTSTSCFVYSQ